jgi:hypothetical protein
MFSRSTPLSPRLVLAGLAVSIIAGAGEPAPIDPPPVKRVVLYKHGMGYIERQGKVKDNASLTLAFRTDQMKDLLTSFFAVDLGGGKISAVQYETRDPLSKQLRDILITVPENAALSQFLAQLKGARLTAKAAGESVAGRIMGVEPLNQIVNNQPVQTGYRLVLLTDAGPIRSLDLYGITEYSLSDEALQRDLKRLLDLSLDSKYTNRKKLTLSVTGQGERELRLGYLLEMPIWKCSYRVIFDDKNKEAAPLLQGWALAENTTEDDWDQVAISFVAGNPLSYIMDLYSPFYVRRPEVPIPGLQDLAVDWAAAPPPDIADAQPARRAAPMAEKAKTAAKREYAANVAQSMDQLGGRAGAPPAPAAAAADRPMGDLMATSIGATAQGVKVGELFSYESQEKVSIPRGQAAMVPILSKPMNGRRLLYYKASFSPKATNAFVMRNDTDLTLEAGAVMFYEGGTSLGEGILGHTLPPGSQEVVPYAVDASVDINPQQASKREPVFKGRLVDGILTLTCVETMTNTWKIVNRGKEAATLWLNQPKNMAYRLSKPEKPLKEVDNHYRFEVPLKPGETVDFLVEEKREVYESVHLANCAEDQIRFYLAQPYLSAGAKAFLKDVGDLMAQKSALQREINESNQQTQRLTAEQDGLRKDLDTFRMATPREQELRAKAVESLATNRAQLTELRKKLDDAGSKVRQLEELLAKKVREYKDE